MKVTTFSKFGVTLGAAALLVCAISVPASADPTPAGTFGTLVGLGSDTTQDVMNGIAAASGGKIASYDATGTTSTVVTRPGTNPVNVPRGSGSGPGRDLLRVAIGQITNATIAVAPTGTAVVNGANAIGQVDFARSSGGPSSTDANDAGVLTYIPFATDAVTVAVDPTSPLNKIPSITLGTANDAAGVPSLFNIYKGAVRYVYLNADGSYNSVGLESTGPSGTTATKISPLLPKSGSGTRSYFLGKVGLDEAKVTTLKASGVLSDTYLVGGTATDVQEHDGSAVAGNASAIVPFSIGQWVAQANTVAPDRRHGVVLASLNGTTPTTGTGTAYALNPAYNAMTRPVYNIVPSKLADDATSNIAKAFVGTSSLVCTDTATITKYGFGLMTGTGEGATACGNTLTRAYTATDSTLAQSVSTTSTTTGKKITLTGTVTSTNNGGGTVVFTDSVTSKALATATIANGETVGSVDYIPTGVGTLKITSVFVPALAGVKSSSVTTSTDVTVAGAPSTTELSTTTSTVIGKSTGVIAWVTSPDTRGGTVTLLDGETKLTSKVLAAGENGAYLTFTPTKLSYNLIVAYTPPADSTTIPSTSAARAVVVTAAKSTVAGKATKTIKSSAKGKFTVTVTASGVTPTGTVSIKEGSKTLTSSAKLSRGKVTVTLPKLKKGSHKLVIKYNGSTTVLAGTKTVTVKVVK